MNTHADQTSVDKNNAVANHLPKQQSDGEAAFKFEDNRPEAIQLRALQEMANNSQQVRQLRSYQEMADHSRRAPSQTMMETHNSATVQRKDADEEDLQLKAFPVQKKENNTGLPDQLKSGIENFSGYSMDDVKVHYNSARPAQLQAHAFAQGTDIHIASGQERHLPHEAWHVVQQKQGRVRATVQMKGAIAVNDDSELEKEADKMGERSMQLNEEARILEPFRISHQTNQMSSPAQLAVNTEVKNGVLNVAGELHNDWKGRRNYEKQFVLEKTNGTRWLEGAFTGADQFGRMVHGDGLLVRLRYIFDRSFDQINRLITPNTAKIESKDIVDRTMKMIFDYTKERDDQPKLTYAAATQDEKNMMSGKNSQLLALWDSHIREIYSAQLQFYAVDGDTDLPDEKARVEQKKKILLDLSTNSKTIQQSIEDILGPLMGQMERQHRSWDMHEVAKTSVANPGVWKIGNDHVKDIIKEFSESGIPYNLLDKDDYDKAFNEWRQNKYGTDEAALGSA